MDDDDYTELPPAKERSYQLLLRYTLEREVERKVSAGGDMMIMLKLLLRTCHGCGDDLPHWGRPPHLLCPRCEAETVWKLN